MIGLCPLVLELDRANLDVLAGDGDLLEVTNLVFPLLLEVYAVAVLKLDGLHSLACLCLEELDAAVLREVALCHPSQQVGCAIVQT